MSQPKAEMEPSTAENGNGKVDLRQVDVAAAYLNGTESYEPLTAGEAKKMLRKTDLILLPMV
jgi:hypothetical protein